MDEGWRVQIGVRLLAHTPLGDAQRARFLAEEERERKTAEFEAELRRQELSSGGRKC
jgi:hypothetical protein